MHPIMNHGPSSLRRVKLGVRAGHSALGRHVDPREVRGLARFPPAQRLHKAIAV
jgi:hypothetical protein